MKTLTTLLHLAPIAAFALLGPAAWAGPAHVYDSVELQMARGMNPVPAAVAGTPGPAREHRTAGNGGDSLELKMARGMNWLTDASASVGDAIISTAQAITARGH